MQKVVVRGGGRKEGEGGVVGRKEKGWAETVYLMRFGERKPELLGQGKAEKGRHTFLNNGGYTHLICPPKEKGMGGGDVPHLKGGGGVAGKRPLIHHLTHTNSHTLKGEMMETEIFEEIKEDIKIV